MDTTERRSSAFVVRIWWEGHEQNASKVGWRGCVQHVASGRKIYFQDLATLQRLIAEEAGMIMVETSTQSSGIG